MTSSSSFFNFIKWYLRFLASKLSPPPTGGSATSAEIQTINGVPAELSTVLDTTKALPSESRTVLVTANAVPDEFNTLQVDMFHRVLDRVGY